MKRNKINIAIATGFIFLLGSFFFVFAYVLIEYNLLSKERVGLFPPNQQFSINKSEEVPIRKFSIEEETAENIPILLYHRIVESTKINELHYISDEINPMIVLKEDFEKQMAYLKDNDYVTLTLQELYFYLTYGIEIPEKSVVLTFDDGYKDNFIEAYPILKKYNFNAVNFVITGAISKRTQSYTPKHVQYLSLKELKKASDVFEYQSHTYYYHKREKNEQDEIVSYLGSRSYEQILDDIETSVHNLNGENLAFAYPYGEYSASTIDILKDLEYKMAFTTENRAASREDHLYEIPRFSILYATTFEEFKEYVNN